VFLFKVFGKTSCLESASSDSPRLVLFVDVKAVRSSFIVGEGCKWEIPNPSVLEGLSFLLAAYYAMHREFPKMYKNVLIFLETKLFGLPPSGALGSKLKTYLILI